MPLKISLSPRNYVVTPRVKGLYSISLLNRKWGDNGYGDSTYTKRESLGAVTICRASGLIAGPSHKVSPPRRPEVASRQWAYRCAFLMRGTTLRCHPHDPSLTAVIRAVDSCNGVILSIRVVNAGVCPSSSLMQSRARVRNRHRSVPNC